LAADTEVAVGGEGPAAGRCCHGDHIAAVCRYRIGDIDAVVAGRGHNGPGDAVRERRPEHVAIAARTNSLAAQAQVDDLCGKRIGWHTRNGESGCPRDTVDDVRIPAAAFAHDTHPQNLRGPV